MNAIQPDNRGLVVRCPSCSQQNRLPYPRLNAPPRCAKCGTKLQLPAEPIGIPDDITFESFTTLSALPVLVDFWAEWCGPCKMVAPELIKVAALGAGRWLVAKVNTEEVTGAPQRYRINSIPTLVLFKGGREIARQSGAMPASSILQFIGQHVDGTARHAGFGAR